MGPIQSGINQLLLTAGGAVAIGKKLHADIEPPKGDAGKTSAPTKVDKNVQPKKQRSKSTAEVMSDLATKGQEKVLQNTLFQDLIKSIAEEEKQDHGEEQRTLAELRADYFRRN